MFAYGKSVEHLLTTNKLWLCLFSANGLSKNSDEPEMMDIDYIEKAPKKASHKTVNSLFRGMRLNDNRSVGNNVIQPPKFCTPPKRYDKIAGSYAESSPGYYASSYSVKDDYEFDTQSIFSQNSFRPQYLSPSPSLCHHQSVIPYTYYASTYNHHNQQNQLNMSQSSNASNIPQTVEWTKMLLYTIPGIVLLSLQCYLLYDIKDFMKQKWN